MSSRGLSLLKQSDRFRWLIFKLIGHVVRVRCVDNRTFEGLLHDASPSATGVSVELRHVRQVGTSVLIKHQEAIHVKSQEIEEIDAINVGWMVDKSVRHSRKGFNTDTGISRAPGFDGQRELVAWSDDSSNLDLDGDLDSEDASNNWDQFETAKKLWGFQSTYDENLYTTRLDKGSSFYKEKVAEAERIAAEIMSQQTNNPHVAEERGQESELLSKMDDADRYSDVIRDESELNLPTTPADATPSAQPVTPTSSKESSSKAAAAALAAAAEKEEKVTLRADAAEFNPFDQMSFLTSAIKPTAATPPASPYSPSSPSMIPSQYHLPSSPGYVPVSSPVYYPPAPYYSPPTYPHISYPPSPSYHR